MHVIANATIMFNNDAGIQDAVVADNGVGVHDNTGHDNSTSADVRRTRHNGRWVDQGCPFQSLLQAFLKTPLPHAVVPDSHDEGSVATSREGIYSFGRWQKWALAKRLPRRGACVIYKYDLSEESHRPGDIEDDFPVSASSPDDQFPQRRSPKSLNPRAVTIYLTIFRRSKNYPSNRQVSNDVYSLTNAWTKPNRDV